jgi:flagellin-like protein
MELPSAWGCANNERKPTMKPTKLFTDERAVSPVVGVALLIAIAVILAAVIGAVVLGLGTTGAETPQAQMEADFADDGSGNLDVTLRHQGGDALPGGEIIVIADGSMADSANMTSDLSAGEQATLTITGNTISDTNTVTVVWDDPNSDSRTVLKELKVE